MHSQNPSHLHGPQCSHSHGAPQMPSPEIPRVFLVYSCLSGQLIQRLFLQLPLMAQFYQIYQMMKMMVWNQPIDFYFNGVNSIIHRFPSVYVKRLLGGFAIPFFLAYFFTINYVLSHQIPDLVAQYSIDFLLKCSIVSSGTIYIFLFVMDPGCLTSKEDRLELQNIMQKRPEIGNPRNFCQFCAQPRIARSFHCTFCESCVTKWEKHSFIFNRCVGAGNQVLYLLFELNLTFLSVILLSATLMKKTTPHPHSFWGTLMFFIILYNFITSFQETLIQSASIFYNVTSFELMNCRRLNYLWKNKHAEFFNPFDKGYSHNILEAFESVMPETTKAVPSDIEQNQDLPMINPETIINWRKAKIFTVLDIANSPLRVLLLEEMKKMQPNQNFNNNNNINNNGGMVINKKENPFETPFQGGVQMKSKEMEKAEETEKEVLVVKVEESNNPFTN